MKTKLVIGSRIECFYDRGLVPHKGYGLASGGRKFIDTDKNGVCDFYERSVKKFNFET